jgi:hypothetical protein
MAQKRKPNIPHKPVIAERPKTGPVVIAKSEAAKSKVRQTEKEKGIGILFDKRNYLIMIGGILLIILGFILMAGGGSDDPKVFNAKELFSARRLTWAPLLILLGYAVEVVAIMMKPKPKTEA